ncbi:MAG: SLC13 family permease, partial [Selenomonas massiliensis]
MDHSGAGKLIADFVVGLIGYSPAPRVIVAAMFVLSCGLTQFMSNTAAAALLAPIAISIAQTIGVSPYPVVMAIGIAASCAFTTPVATPPNTLVLGPGQFRFMDYVKVGVPLVIVSLIVCLVVIPLVWPF